MAEHRMGFTLTIDGTTFPGTEKVDSVPEAIDAQAAGPYIIGGSTDLWGLTPSEAEVEGATFGVSFRRPAADTDIHGRGNDIVWMRVWYEETVSNPKVVLCQNMRRIPDIGVITDGTPGASRS